MNQKALDELYKTIVEQVMASGGFMDDCTWDENGVCNNPDHIETSDQNHTEDEDEELLKCKDCDVELADLTLTLCPYANEVYDTHVWVQICDACFCERQKAIKNGKMEALEMMLKGSMWS